MKNAEDLMDLPGGALVQQGLADFARGLSTAAACLVEIAQGRFVKVGLLSPTESARPQPDPELRLYRLLRAEGGDAYSRYNSLLRELSSFHSALQRRKRREKRDEG